LRGGKDFVDTDYDIKDIGTKLIPWCSQREEPWSRPRKERLPLPVRPRGVGTVDLSFQKEYINQHANQNVDCPSRKSLGFRWSTRRTFRQQSGRPFIEAAVRALIAQIEREMQDARHMEIINREADRLNREAEEVWSFQVISWKQQVWALGKDGQTMLREKLAVLAQHGPRKRFSSGVGNPQNNRKTQERGEDPIAKEFAQGKA
jgi:hypothetical protein